MTRFAVSAALLLMTTTAAHAQEDPEIGTPVQCLKSAGCTEDPQLIDGLSDAAAESGVSEQDLLGALNTLADAGVRTTPRAYLCAADGLLCPPAPAVTHAPSAPGASVWDRLAQCESGGNWHAATGNGFAGGLQFTPSTWRSHGGVGSPAQASRGQQIAVAQRVLADQGWARAWPECSRRLGLQ